MSKWLLHCAVATLIVGCTSSGDPGTVDSTTTSTAVEMPTEVSDPPPAIPLRACPPTYSGIVAIDPATGAYLWNHCGAADESLRVVGQSDNLVYVAETDERGEAALIALDATTLTERFTIDVPTLNESYHLDALRAPGPFAADGVIVLSISSGSAVDTVGYDSSTGEEVWRRPADEAFVAANGNGYVLVAEPSPLECDSGACRDTRMMAALDRSTGVQQLWSLDEPTAVLFWPLEDLLVISRGTPTTLGTAIALDPLSGELRWDATTLQGMNVIASGNVLVGIDAVAFGPDGIDAGEGTARAVDASSGGDLWSSAASFGGTGLEPIFGLASLVPIAADDARIYLRRAGATAALDTLSGEVVWEVEGEIAPFRALEAGVVGVAGDSLHLLSLDDGSGLWTTPVGDTSRITNVIATEDVILVSWS